LEHKLETIAWSQAPKLPESKTIESVVNRATGSPSTENDRCIGVTCSGHGKCVDKSSGQCQCRAGWFPSEGNGACSTFVLNATLVGNTNECQGSPKSSSFLLPLSGEVPGKQSIFCSAARAKWNGQSTLQLRLNSLPVAPTGCTVSITPPSEARPVSNQIELPMRDGPGLQVQLEGMTDNWSDGDQPFQIQVACSGQDARFDGAKLAIPGVNLDVAFPNIKSVYPTVSVFIGQQLTITGKNLFEDPHKIDFQIGGVQVQISEDCEFFLSIRAELCAGQYSTYVANHSGQ
jgi:hypothetical protein